jgi:glycosyltransferase involved in cell wall biosynthesis
MYDQFDLVVHERTGQRDFSVGRACDEVIRKHTIAAVIPLYNGQKFIAEALGSVLAQSRRPDEIIVVDDGSTDQGPEIVADMARREPIILVSKANEGQSAARNFGIRHAKSSLIALLDQDDLWYRRHLEALEEPFLRHSDADRIGWVHSDLDIMNENGGMIEHRTLLTSGTAGPKTNLRQCLGSDLFILPSASMFLKSAFEVVGGFDEQLSGYEDDDFFLRLFLARYLNVFLEGSFSVWRAHSLSCSNSPRIARSRMLYAEKLFNIFSESMVKDCSFNADYIAPRFIKTMLRNDLLPALNAKDFPAMRLIVKDIKRLLLNASPGLQHRMEFPLKLMNFPVLLKNKHIKKSVVRKIRCIAS